MDITKSGYLFSDRKEFLQISKIQSLLGATYWANKRTIETLLKSIDNSLCFGIYKDNIQVGFARCVTDYATVYWLCDVIIDDEHRGIGLGKEFVKYITEHDDLKLLYGILGTRDAHGLYEKFGFERDQKGFMHKC